MNNRIPTSKVTCSDCTHFVPGSTPEGLGFCGVTTEKGGLPPVSNQHSGYQACFPHAPRICEQHRAS